jgi:hypothetical protein
MGKPALKSLFTSAFVLFLEKGIVSGGNYETETTVSDRMDNFFQGKEDGEKKLW